MFFTCNVAWLSDKHKQTVVNDYGEPVVVYKLGLWHFETFNVSERVCTK